MDTHDVWETIHKNKNWGAYPTEHIIRFMASNYYNRERRQTRILDFGCGTGAHTWYLAREGFDTYAFDISETAIRKLAIKLSEEHLHANIQVMNGIKLSYENNFFDAVIDNVSIQANKIQDIRIMYENVYSVLKKAGKFITVVFGKKTTGYGTGKEIEAGTYENVEKGCLQGLGCKHFFDENELEKILKSIGFKNVGIDYIIYSDRGNIVNQLVAVGEK